LRLGDPRISPYRSASIWRDLPYRPLKQLISFVRVAGTGKCFLHFTYFEGSDGQAFMSKAKDETSPSLERTGAGTDRLSLPEELERRRGIPKSPPGWWTAGLTAIAILIAAALWLQYA
jgi:hypothetical protein